LIKNKCNGKMGKKEDKQFINIIHYNFTKNVNNLYEGYRLWEYIVGNDTTVPEGHNE